MARASAAASRDVLDTVLDLRDRRVSYALATVIEAKGSTSARVGSKAVIAENGHVLAGWVGGGCAESTVCHSALACLGSGETTIVDIDLTSEVLGAGMPCGGSMRVYVEAVRPRPRLWLLGHGKVAEVLCMTGAIAGFDVFVDDPMADREHYPAAIRILAGDQDYRELNPTARDYVVVATQHKGNHQSIARCLRSPVSYIALIASRKRSRLVLDYLRTEGFGDSELARVRAPAGLDLGAETPEEIALSVLSEIVMLRRGADGVPRSRKASETSNHA
ncbi:MAG: XdhC family protein [Alphaproteobacteria bacterium]|nr:XdhC family protein [Alphaproteobacteria bacterium]